MNTNTSTFMLLYEWLAKVERNGTFLRCRFGDGRLGDKSVKKHDAFDGSAFYVLFQKKQFVFSFRFRV